MKMKISCPDCSATLRLPESVLGKKLRCPKCRNTFTVEADNMDGLEPLDSPEPAETPESSPIDAMSALAALAAASSGTSPAVPTPPRAEPPPPEAEPEPVPHPPLAVKPAPEPQPEPEPPVAPVRPPAPTPPAAPRAERPSAPPIEVAPTVPPEPEPDDVDQPADVVVTSIPIGRMARVVDSVGTAEVSIEILEYAVLAGGSGPRSAEALYHAAQGKVRLKQPRLRLNDTAVVLKKGEIQFVKGRIDVTVDDEAGTETCQGVGEIYLQPSFGHFILKRLADESLVVGPGLFRACQDSVTLTDAPPAYDDGPAQTKVAGPGVCLLWSPVGPDEIVCCELADEALRVEPDLVLMFDGDSGLSLQSAPKGQLLTLTGSGRLWIAPTRGLYDRLSHGGWA